MDWIAFKAIIQWRSKQIVCQMYSFALLKITQIFSNCFEALN